MGIAARGSLFLLLICSLAIADAQTPSMDDVQEEAVTKESASGVVTAIDATAS